VEHGAWSIYSPRALSTTDGMGEEATTFYKWLVEKISQKLQ